MKPTPGEIRRTFYGARYRVVRVHTVEVSIKPIPTPILWARTYRPRAWVESDQVVEVARENRSRVTAGPPWCRL